MTPEQEMSLHEWVSTLPPIHRAARELVALEAELASARKDAEDTHQAYEACLPYAKRYDWLRRRTVLFYEDDSKADSALPMWSDILDTAIDAAIAREQGEKL